MADTTKRLGDGPYIKSLKGTEAIAAQAFDGGTATDDGVVGEGADISVTLRQLLGMTVNAVAVAGGIATIDAGNGLNRHHAITLTGNVTLAIANPAPTGFATEGELLITQDATGNWTAAFPAGWKPLGGSDTSPAAAAGKVTRLSFVSYDGGVTVDYAMQERGA